MNNHHDFYIPEQVDEQLETILRTGQASERDLRVIEVLQAEFFTEQGHMTSADKENKQILARVLSHLLHEEERSHSPKQRVFPSVYFRWRIQEKREQKIQASASKRRQESSDLWRQKRPFLRRLYTFAAVLTLLVLVGMFLIVLNMAHQQRGTTTARLTMDMTSTPVAAPPISKPGKIVYSALLPKGGVSHLSWAPQGQRIAGNVGDLIESWDALSGKNIVQYKVPGLGMGGAIDLAWSPNGTRLAIVVDKIYLFNAKTGDLQGTLEKPLGITERNESSVAPFYTQVAGSWSLLNDRMPLSPGAGAFVSVTWSPDNSQVAGAYNDGQTGFVSIWNAQTGQLERTINGLSGGPLTVAWSPQGNLLGVLVLEPTSNAQRVLAELTLWNTNTWVTEQQYKNLYSFAWSPDGKELALVDSGSAYGQDVRLIDLETEHSMRTFAQNESIVQVYWSPTGDRIAVDIEPGNYDSVQIWNPTNGQRFFTFSPHVYETTWSPDGKYIANVTMETQPRLLVWAVR